MNGGKLEQLEFDRIEDDVQNVLRRAIIDSTRARAFVSAMRTLLGSTGTR